MLHVMNVECVGARLEEIGTARIEMVGAWLASPYTVMLDMSR